MRVDIVINERAGMFLARPAAILAVEKAAAGRARVWRTASLAALESACKDIARAESTLVLLAGGDGSHMAGVTALVNAYGEKPLPRVALVSGGTVNTVAANFARSAASSWIPPATYVRSLLGAALHPSGGKLSAVPRPTLKVTESPTGVARVGFIFGAGLVANFFEAYEQGGARGRLVAAKMMARVFVQSLYGGAFAERILAPVPLDLYADEHLLAGNAWTLVVASVVKNLGLSLRVTRRAAEDFSRPHLVASPLPPRRLGPRAPRVLLGIPLGGDGAFDGLAGQIRVEFRDGEGKYVLDGDLFRAAAVEVRAGPVLSLVTP